MTTDTKPDVIQGGCLCEGVRYRITFPADHDFANATSTCQCEQCRKQTGSLIFRVHKLPSASITFTSDRTLKRFYATPGIARGFCGECGSLLFWMREGRGDISVTVGGFDKDVLKKYGPLLTKANLHIWFEDAVPGVTDNLEGAKWKYDDEGEGAEML